MGTAAAPGETVKDVLFFVTQRAQPHDCQGLRRHVHCKAAADGGSSRYPTAVSRCTVCGMRTGWAPAHQDRVVLTVAHATRGQEMRVLAGKRAASSHV